MTWRRPLLLVLLATLARADSMPPRTLVGMSSCMPLDGPATLYMAPGACLDLVEANATVPVRGPMTFVNLSCRLSGATGSATVAVTARTGACGTPVDTTFSCTIPTSGQACDSAGKFLSLGTERCLTFKIAISGALPAPRHLTCTMERS